MSKDELDEVQKVIVATRTISATLRGMLDTIDATLDRVDQATATLRREGPDHA